MDHIYTRIMRQAALYADARAKPTFVLRREIEEHHKALLEYRLKGPIGKLFHFPVISESKYNANIDILENRTRDKSIRTKNQQKIKDISKTIANIPDGLEKRLWKGLVLPVLALSIPSLIPILIWKEYPDKIIINFPDYIAIGTMWTVYGSMIGFTMMRYYNNQLKKMKL